MGIQLNTGSIKSPKKVQVNIDDQIKGIKKVQANIDGVIKNLWASGRQLAELNVGDKIKFGRYQVASEAPEEMIWVIAAKNHVSVPAYPMNAITLVTEKVIDLRSWDAKEPTNANANRQSNGNNNYPVSNIDQWINKDSDAGAWYVPAHSADGPPNTSDATGGYNTQYTHKAGFLKLFTEAEKSAILATTIRVAKPTVDGGGYNDISRKLFLLSTTEVGLANEGGIAEGAKLPIFTNDASRVAYLTQQAYLNSPSTSKPPSVNNSIAWWLRTPYISGSSQVRNNGLGILHGLYGNIGIRPACNLSSTTIVSDQVDADGCYVIL